MKKIVAMLGVALLVAGMAYAASDTGTVDTSIQVASNFDLELGATAISYGLTAPGDASAQKQVTINAVSNTGNNWEIRMKASQMTDGTNTIPIENCKVALFLDDTAAGTSDFDYDTGTKDSLTAVDTDEFIYDSGAAETGSLLHQLVLYVTVPGGQQSGQYSNQVTITMIEDGTT